MDKSLVSCFLLTHGVYTKLASVSLCCKSHCFKTKYHLHIISTETSYRIYTSQWPVININAHFCAYNVWINF